MPFPGFVIGGSHHDQKASHLTVAEAAEFGAGNFILARRVHVNLEGDFHTGDNILLGAQFTHKEIVDNIARMEEE